MMRHFGIYHMIASTAFMGMLIYGAWSHNWILTFIGALGVLQAINHMNWYRSRWLHALDNSVLNNQDNQESAS